MNKTMKRVAKAMTLVGLIGISQTTIAHGDDMMHGDDSAAGAGHHNHHMPQAAGHAPIGVMGDHMHKKGEFMFSYRFMHMNMTGNRIGSRSVSPQEIVNTVPNQFDQLPMPGIQPGTLRVVPTKMTMDMHMFGAMYAPTDNITLMLMLNYIEKEMDHLTFAGMNPNLLLGGFTTRSQGLGDTKISALYRLYDDSIHHLHLNMGLSLPTGDIEKTGAVLSPLNTRPTLRLPYAMQLGTGTFDLLPGITYTARLNDLSWGAQYMAEVRLEDENDEGYAWGDKHTVTGWLAYQWAPWISTSVRVSYEHQGEIDGFDPQIAAPVQTAHPDFFGGERVDLYGGVNLVATHGPLKGHRLAIEAGGTVHEDLNGPQMQRDWTLTVGWQKAF